MTADEIHAAHDAAKTLRHAMEDYHRYVEENGRGHKTWLPLEEAKVVETFIGRLAAKPGALLSMREGE